jgi:sec-independent protein translocase protein TatA
MLGTWELLIILLIVVVLFGTKKLKNIGGDLGGAIKNFRQSMRDGEKEKQEDADKQPSSPEPITPAAQVAQDDKGKIIEGLVTSKQTGKV